MKNRASLLTALRSRELWAADHSVVFDLCWNVAHRSDLEWTAAFTRPGEPAAAQGPVRVIPVYGMLEPRASVLDEYFGVTSLQSVREAFRAAMRDPSTKAIVLDVDSPGGNVAGVTELASEVRAARGGRVRIVAVADSLMASAALWIAAQADEVVASPSAQVGSIGIIAIHQEFSRALEAEGVTTTVLATPAAKSEGNPFEPLTPEARAAIEERQAALYATFTSDMAKGRRVSVDKVRSDFGQGRVMLAHRALEAGLIDRVATLDEVVAGLSSSISGAARSGRHGATAEWLRLESTAIGFESTDTSSDPWDGPAEEAKIPNDLPADQLRAFYAWQDPEADPETKAAYKFDHHFSTADGTAGAASTAACSAGIGYLNRAPGATGRPDIPDADRRGVYEHLAGHLRDAGTEPPELQGAAPAAERLAAVATELSELAAWAQSRARLRASEGRPRFSTRTEAALRATRDAIDALLSGDPGEGAVGQPVQPAAQAAPSTPRKAPSRDEFLRSLAQRGTR